MLLCLLLATGARASKHRGVWFWKHSGNPWGSETIVGNNTLENQTIAFFNARSIKRVYGSYGNRPVSEPGEIAAWNAKLQAAGIQSQCLMSENTWIFPGNHASFLEKVEERVIDFNNAPGRLASEKFDALLIALQNLPEGFNAFREIRSGGTTSRRILVSFSLLALLGPLCGLAGFHFLAGHPATIGAIMLFAAGGILYLVFQDIAPQAKLERHWTPPLGAVAGFLLGLIGQLVLG